MHQMWTKDVWVATLHIQTCVCGTWAGIRKNTGEAEGAPKAPSALLATECRRPSSYNGFQRLRMWDIELKRHFRSAPICLEDNLQPSSAKGHCLQGKTLPMMDAKTRSVIQGWTLIQSEWKPRGGQRKQSQYNPSGFSYHLGQGLPKSGLHITEGMGNDTFIIIIIGNYYR